jgi:hypothetical protein
MRKNEEDPSQTLFHQFLKQDSILKKKIFNFFLNSKRLFVQKERVSEHDL